MGYYTTFKLEIIEGNDNVTDYAKEIGECSGYGHLFDDQHKWYDCEDDMKKISLNHPNTVFKISGEGEESGDIWSRYFKNGKCQYVKAQIVVGQYNENNLK